MSFSNPVFLRLLNNDKENTDHIIAVFYFATIFSFTTILDNFLFILIYICAAQRRRLETH